MAKQLKGALITFLTENANRIFTLTQISAAIGEDETRVRVGINNLRNSANGSDADYWRRTVEVVSQGTSWVYRPDNKTVKTRTLYEEIGHSKTGTIIVEDENGKLFRLEEL